MMTRTVSGSASSASAMAWVTERIISRRCSGVRPSKMRICAIGTTYLLDEPHGDRTQTLYVRSHMIALLHGNGLGDAARHDEHAGGNAFVALCEQVGERGQTLRRMSEYCGAGAECHALTVLLQHHAEIGQVELADIARPHAHDEPGRRGVVGNDAFQVELEILIPRIDHLDRRNREIRGRQRIGDGAPRPLERMTRDEGNLGLHSRVNQIRHGDGAVRGNAEIVGKKSIDRRLDAIHVTRKATIRFSWDAWKVIRAPPIRRCFYTWEAWAPWRNSRRPCSNRIRRAVRDMPSTWRSGRFEIRNVRSAHTAILDEYPLRAQPSRLLAMLKRCLREHNPTTGA